MVYTTLKIFHPYSNLDFFSYLSAEIFADPEQHFRGEEQHNRVPSARGHHFPPDGQERGSKTAAAAAPGGNASPLKAL